MTYVLGEKVFENPGIKARISCVPSEPYFIGSESADGMAGFYRAMFPAFDLARYFELEKRFEVDHTKPLRKLSRGMRAQAAIWLALSIRADVLLPDEPMETVSTPSPEGACGAWCSKRSRNAALRCSLPVTT